MTAPEQLTIPIPDTGDVPLATGWRPWPHPTSHLVWGPCPPGPMRTVSLCGIRDAQPYTHAYRAEVPTPWQPHWCAACIDVWETDTGRTGTIPRMPA